VKVFALLVVLAMVFAQGQSEEPAPYLYYFSDFLNAIVIERADGSDSRKLGEGLMPPDTDIVVGDWSPSGEWFAWRSGRWNEGGNVSYSGWIMSADGRRRLTVLDAIENVEIMEWSSVEDLLLVRSGYIPDGPEFTYYLIDVPNEEIITSFTLDSSVLWEHPSPVRWTPDGEHIGFYYYSPIQVGDQLEMRYFFRTVSRSGEIRDEQVNFIEGQHSVWAAPPTFSPDGKILYATPDRNALVVNDLTSGDVIIFDQPPEGISAVEWSASGDYALLFTQRNCGGQIPCADLWLLSASNDELSLIAENSSYAFPFIKLWSPQEDVAYFSTLEGDVYLLDAESGETAHLGRFKTDPASNDFISASWSTDGRQLLILSDSYRTLSLVDMVQAEIVYSETGEFRYNVGWESHTENFVFSPDNRYIALSNQNAVLDTLTNQVTRFITHSAAAYTTGQQAIYNWHSGSEWLVTGDLVFFAGGGGGPWANIVTRVDGTGRRELTKAVHIADWLPDNVIPHLSPGQPTSVLPAPALTLVHDSYVNGVAWHETQLAVHTVDGQVTIWDINDSGARQVRTFAVTAGCGEYPIPCRMSWSPDGRMLAIREEQEGFGIWDVEGGRLIERLEGRTLTWMDNGGYATSDEMMSRSPDRQWIARVSLQNNPPQDVKIISAESNDTLWFVPLQGPFDLQWTPDSRYLLMVSGLAESKILDVRRGLVSELGDFTSYYGFDISPDGRLLAGASIYRTIQLWELPNGALSRRLNWYAMAAAFSDDGRYLAAGNTRLATIWESGD
jgi:WD40 repeat protein